MKLLEVSHGILSRTGYSVYQYRLDSLEFIGFEDASIFGFCSAFDSTDELIDQWKPREETIFEKFEMDFLSAGDKVWNAYCVFLCADSKSSVQKRRLEKIEQNVELSRKIVAAGITSELELENALLPLLPFQHKVELPSEKYLSRFLSRFQIVSPELATVIANPNVTDDNIIKALDQLR